VPADAIGALRPIIEHIGAGRSILDDREAPASVRILLDGWALRQKTLRDGRRQIVGLLLPNDVGASWTPLGPPRAPDVRALTACRVLRVEAEALAALVRRSPSVAARLVERASGDAAITHAWLLNIGQRKAPERMAHLFCELAFRMELSGLSRRGEAPTIPLTQQDLADALGMTSVHVNRVLQRLKGEAMIDIRKGSVSLLDTIALGRVCDFDAAYLAPAPLPVRV
jgi:CRP-like cAMP-binding protein